MSDALRIIPLGGLGEVGKNMTVYELGEERILIDAGSHSRATSTSASISCCPISPTSRTSRCGRSCSRTGTRTCGRAAVRAARDRGRRGDRDPAHARPDQVQARRARALRLDDLREADPADEPMQLGPFRLEYVRMAHSIPDCVAILVETSAGRVLHTGDWKLDHTPVDGLKPTSASSPRSETVAST